jgi:hypothetical protein
MRGAHPPQAAPLPGALYAILLDVAGEDEGAGQALPLTPGPSPAATGERLSNPGRDATALTIVQVDLATVSDPLIAAPTYRAVRRFLWTGIRHTALYAQLRAIVAEWAPRYVVVDSTGVGAGLASFLAAALPPGVVLPFEFNSATKSQLGWDFLAIVDTGRWRDYAVSGGASADEGALAGDDPEAATFWRELAFCQYEVRPGPGRLLRWGVPDGTRDPALPAGQSRVHDDTVISAALCAVLDAQPWYADTGAATIIRAPDPLDALDEGF